MENNDLTGWAQIPSAPEPAPEPVSQSANVMPDIPTAAQQLDELLNENQNEQNVSPNPFPFAALPSMKSVLGSMINKDQPINLEQPAPATPQPEQPEANQYIDQLQQPQSEHITEAVPISDDLNFAGPAPIVDMPPMPPMPEESPIDITNFEPPVDSLLTPTEIELGKQKTSKKGLFIGIFAGAAALITIVIIAIAMLNKPKLTPDELFANSIKNISNEYINMSGSLSISSDYLLSDMPKISFTSSQNSEAVSASIGIEIPSVDTLIPINIYANKDAFYFKIEDFEELEDIDPEDLDPITEQYLPALSEISDNNWYRLNIKNSIFSNLLFNQDDSGDFATKYKNNPFLKISPYKGTKVVAKKSTLYDATIDAEKFANFTNQSEDFELPFNNFQLEMSNKPEIDRLIFKASENLMDIEFDINLTYPASINITEPSIYKTLDDASILSKLLGIKTEEDMDTDDDANDNNENDKDEKDEDNQSTTPIKDHSWMF